LAAPWFTAASPALLLAHGSRRRGGAAYPLLHTLPPPAVTTLHPCSPATPICHPIWQLPHCCSTWPGGPGAAPTLLPILVAGAGGAIWWRPSRRHASGCLAPLHRRRLACATGGWLRKVAGMGSAWAGVGAGSSHWAARVVVMVVVQVVWVVPRGNPQQQVTLVTLQHQHQQSAAASEQASSIPWLE
jgi:hypothetical protein